MQPYVLIGVSIYDCRIFFFWSFCTCLEMFSVCFGSTEWNTQKKGWYSYANEGQNINITLCIGLFLKSIFKVTEQKTKVPLPTFIFCWCVSICLILVLFVHDFVYSILWMYISVCVSYTNDCFMVNIITNIYSSVWMWMVYSESCKLEGVDIEKTIENILDRDDGCTLC